MEESCNKYNRWNRLVAIMKSNNQEVYTTYKEHSYTISMYAKMILGQMNTAGGAIIIGSEADSFIMENKNLWVKSK